MKKINLNISKSTKVKKYKRWSHDVLKELNISVPERLKWLKEYWGSYRCWVSVHTMLSQRWIRFTQYIWQYWRHQNCQSTQVLALWACTSSLVEIYKLKTKAFICNIVKTFSILKNNKEYETLGEQNKSWIETRGREHHLHRRSLVMCKSSLNVLSPQETRRLNLKIKCFLKTWLWFPPQAVQSKYDVSRELLSHVTVCYIILNKDVLGFLPRGTLISVWHF